MRQSTVRKGYGKSGMAQGVRSAAQELSAALAELDKDTPAVLAIRSAKKGRVPVSTS
jgi:hypothetical protein